MTNIITIDRDTLHKAMGRAKRVAARKSTYPICEHVKMIACGERMTITATDLDTFQTDTVACEGFHDESFTLPCYQFADLVAKTPKGSQITITVDRTAPYAHIIKTALIAVTMQGLSSDDFPMVSNHGNAIGDLIMTADQFRLAWDTCHHAISNEAVRYYLNGLHFFTRKGALYCEATDGHRLARVRVCDAPADAEISAILPVAAATAIAKAIGKKGGDDLSLRFYRMAVSVRIGSDLIMDCKLIDGTFPDADRVIPKKTNAIGRFKIEPAGVLPTIAGLATQANRKDAAITLNLDTLADTIGLSVKGAADSIAKVDIPGKWKADNCMTLGINGRYLADTLKALSGSATFHVGRSDGPVLIRDAGNADAIHVVMPMRV